MNFNFQPSLQQFSVQTQDMFTKSKPDPPMLTRNSYSVQLALSQQFNNKKRKWQKKLDKSMSQFSRGSTANSFGRKG